MSSLESRMSGTSPVNEVGIMHALFADSAEISITTTVNADPVSGPLAWFDIGNIAIVVGKEVVVFPKRQIETWSYISHDDLPS